MNTQADQLFGDDVCTQDGEKIGTVDNVWVDDATDETEFIGVKTGWLFGKTHVIPTADAQFDDNTITVPYSKDQIENAPSFDTDAEISPDEEQQIYSYFGLDRSTSASPTGLASGESAGTAGAGFDNSTAFSGTTATDTSGINSSTNMTSPDAETDIALSEEELEIGKREVQAGDVRLRKVVRTEHQEVPVELRREDIEIERVPAGEVSNADATGQAFQEQTIDVPLTAEEPVVQKEAHVTGGVRVTKDVETSTQTVGGDVRSEDIEVERDAGTGTPSDRTSGGDF
jgi:uncharacterized protein (TIGR02271 family)